MQTLSISSQIIFYQAVNNKAYYLSLSHMASFDPILKIMEATCLWMGLYGFCLGTPITENNIAKFHLICLQQTEYL